MEDKLIKRTPCIGVCSTTYGDDICRGCRRFRHEITSWINYSDSEKNIINRRLEKFKVALNQSKIRFNQDLEPICWVFDLFRSLNTEDLNLKDFGLAIQKEFANIPLPQLKEDVNKEFYELSLAHYQRYIQPSFFT